MVHDTEEPMEIEELNHRLFDLTQSERAYRSGERYDWAHSNRAIVYDGHSMVQMGDEVLEGSHALRPRTSNGQPLPLEGRFMLKKNSRFNPVPEHIHTYMEMSYVYAGTCHQHVNGRAVTLRENQVLLLDSNCPHSIGELGPNDVTISVVVSKPYLRQLLADALDNSSMVSNFLLNVLNEQTDHNRYVRFRTQGNRRIRRYFQELLCEYYEPSTGAETIILHLLQLILAELVNAYEDAYTHHEQEKQGRRVSVVPIIRYIEDNYLTCTQESVAEHFYISPNYVSTLLKKHTGMTYRQVVQAQKLGRAASLLRNTDLAIAEIARSSGYENQSFFYRKFKERYGCLPAEYRSNHIRG